MKFKNIIICAMSLALTFSIYSTINIHEDAILVSAEDTSTTETTYTDVSKFTFTFDKESRTATLTGYKADAEKEAVVIPPSVNGYTITTIGSNAFNKESISTVTIPNTVTTIGENAFSNCSNLQSVTMGSSVATIGSCAFSSCMNLLQITIPASVTEIGKYALGYCYYNYDSSYHKIEKFTLYYDSRDNEDVIIDYVNASGGMSVKFIGEDLTTDDKYANYVFDVNQDGKIGTNVRRFG